MISDGIASALAATLTAGVAAVALHETAETIRAYAPKSKKQNTRKNKDYQSLIWGY